MEIIKATSLNELIGHLSTIQLKHVDKNFGWWTCNEMDYNEINIYDKNKSVNNVIARIHCSDND